MAPWIITLLLAAGRGIIRFHHGPPHDTVDFSSETIISLSFTAEYAVCEAAPKAVRRGIRKLSED